MATPSLFGSLPLGFVASMDTLDALPAEHVATLVRRSAGKRCLVRVRADAAYSALRRRAARLRLSRAPHRATRPPRCSRRVLASRAQQRRAT
jgi:hypothetical protein